MWGDGSDGMGTGVLWVVGLKDKDGGRYFTSSWMDFWDFGARLNTRIEVTKKRGVTEEEWKQTRSFVLAIVLFSVVGRSFFLVL